MISITCDGPNHSLVYNDEGFFVAEVQAVHRNMANGPGNLIILGRRALERPWTPVQNKDLETRCYYLCHTSGEVIGGSEKPTGCSQRKGIKGWLEPCSAFVEEPPISWKGSSGMVCKLRKFGLSNSSD